MSNYKFFQNKRCEYFPCHKGIKKGEFNCLFCFCPLYWIKCPFPEKDCEKCVYPHKKTNYDSIIGGLRDEYIERLR